MLLGYGVVVLTFISVANSTVSFKSNGVTIIGRSLKTIFTNTSFAAFYRIPYAEPPVNALRFKPPKANNYLLKDFVYDFSKPYSHFSATLNDEDCLYLSVYSPEEKNKTKDFPVLVWTHEYSNCHGPDFFIEEGVLVVTVSYRSSIFGFLYTDDGCAEGNMGPKDILIALKWLRDNINLFNGDSNRITIIGSGIASTSVASMLLSPAAEDLFTRAVIIDGSALSPADYRPSKIQVVNKLFKRLKRRINNINHKKLCQILSNTSTGELLSASRNLYDSTEVRDNQRLINSFSCTIETIAKGAFMNEHPLAIYKRKITNGNIDVIFGYTTLPSLYKLRGLANNRKLLKYLNYNFQYLLPFEGRFDECNSKRYQKITRHIMQFYFINGTIKEQSLRRYAKYVSDQVIYPILRQVSLHREMTDCNIYLYRLAFQGSLNIGWKSSVPNLKWAGATFADEICYLFRCKSKTGYYKSREASNEGRFIRKIVRLIANFAKYGNPTPHCNDNILGNLQWNPLKRNRKLQALNLGQSLRMIDVPEEKRMNFWDQLREELFQN